MERYIVSPKTGKDIIVGGPTYEKLLKTNHASAVKKAKPFEKGTRKSHQHQYGKTTKASEVHKPKSPVKPKPGQGGKTKIHAIIIL